MLPMFLVILRCSGWRVYACDHWLYIYMKIAQIIYYNIEERFCHSSHDILH